MSKYRATIQERGNGFADAGEYVTEQGSLYRILSTGHIQTGRSSGAPNTMEAIVEDADWDDVDDDYECPCTVIIGDEITDDEGKE